MFDQTLIRVCLILGSFITAGYILRRVRHAKVQIEDTIFWLMFSAALLILAMACGSDPFGYDYLYPLMPPGKAALRDGFVRAIWSRLAQKGEVLPRHAKE